MATPVVATTANTAFAAGSSIVITKPTGLAVNDVMIAFIAWFGGAPRTLTAPAGWANAQGDNVVFQGYMGYTKIADAADVAAANFTFTLSGATDNIGGAILRITGAALGSEVTDSEFDSTSVVDATSLAQTCSITPLSSESLVVIGFSPYDGDIPSIVTISGYSSTPALTFTEHLDFGYRDGLSDGRTIAVVSAPKTNTTAITAYTATASQTVSSQRSIVYIVNAPQNVVADVSPLAITPTVNGVTASQVNVVAEVSRIAMPPTINGVVVTDSSDATKWINPDKISTTWINPDK